MTKKEKTTAVPSTQRYINIAEIRNGIIVTKDAQLRHAIKVSPVNFALKSEQDQTVLIGQYQTFLNSLNFPLQILIQSRRLDVTPYIQGLKKKVENIPNELLRYHGFEYLDFIQKLTELTNIMDKQFYTVVSYDPPNLVKPGFFARLFGNKKQSQKISFSEKNWEKYTQELERRADLVVGGLSAIGLRSQIMNTQETIELFYNAYNPEEAMAEKLTAVENLEAPIVSVKSDQKEVKNEETKQEIDKILSGAPVEKAVANSAHSLNEGKTKPAVAPAPVPTPEVPAPAQSQTPPPVISQTQQQK